MRFALGILAFSLSLQVGMQSSAAELDSLARHALRHAKQQLLRSTQELGESTGIPRSTLPDGSWKTVPPNDWTSGFFPGCLWQMYGWSHDSAFKGAAIRWTKALETQQLNTGTHDVGFMMMCSYGNWYRFEKIDATRQVLLRTAQSLASRFNKNVGCTKSWDGRSEWPFPVIVDNMMNLELLFWAAKHGGSRSLYDMAVSHATKTMKNHVRPDGSTYHVVDYDTTTGAVVTKQTHQGYAAESVWSRGQAWAIYGFTVAYRETKRAEFLTTARRTADYFINSLPADHVPFWDFKAPDIPNAARDASAGAIAASGLFDLSTLVKDSKSRTAYREAAKTILASLCQPPYLMEGTASRGIISKATGSRPGNTEVEVSLIYGDYYFLEALHRYLALTRPLH
jgi:unsaturated chondroitin disaccharide hydrolase